MIASLLLAACTASPTPLPLSTESNLFVFNFPRSALMEYSADLTLQRELPINLPCPVTATHPAPNQPLIALELECINGPVVQIVDTNTGECKDTLYRCGQSLPGMGL